MPELEDVKPVESVVAKRVRTGNKDRIKKDEQELKELLAEREGKGVQEGTEDSKDASSGQDHDSSPNQSRCPANKYAAEFG